MRLSRPIAILTAAAAALLARPIAALPPAALDNGRVRVETDSAGAITRCRFAPLAVDLVAPEGAAQSFRLTLEKPGGARTVIIGRQQTLSAARLQPDALALLWNGPLRDADGASHNIAAAMTIRAAGGRLTFDFHLQNRSAAKIVSAAYPFVPGVGAFGGGDSTVWAPTSTPTEVKTASGAGFSYPGQLNMAFLCITSPGASRTLYLGLHDPVARWKTVQIGPNGSSSAPDVQAYIEHSPFVAPGASWDGAAIALEAVEGDWTKAAGFYREWFRSAFGIVQPADDWIRRQSFFVMTMFMLPEGTISLRFRDIPRWARAARDAGIRSVQISGWQMGGHDNGYPLYEPDPRLGTWQELADGIRACHRMGIKVYFFANYQPVMLEMERYRKEWSRIREMGPNGALTWNAGWGMGTLWARAGHPKLMTWANLGFPEFRKLIVDYFAKLASIGGDGVHVDKMFPAGIDYNPAAPLSPDSTTWEGAILLTREIMAACRKLNPDWCMSFECNWDRMLQFGGATWWVGNQLVTRRVFPEHVETLGLYQAYDYLGVNNAVRDGHVVMVAPLNFSRGLDWPPFRGLAAYIRSVKQIRDALADTVFYGVPRGPLPAAIAGEAPDGVAWNLFSSRTGDRQTCILTNSRMEPRTVTFAGFPGAPPGRVRVHIPGRSPVTASAPARITIPAERIAFVEQLGGAQ